MADEQAKKPPRARVVVGIPSYGQPQDLLEVIAEKGQELQVLLSKVGLTRVNPGQILIEKWSTLPTAILTVSWEVAEIAETSETKKPVLCWDCIKGRHGICTGMDDPPPVGTGGKCECPHEEEPDE